MLSSCHVRHCSVAVMHILCLLLDRLYAVESARLIAEQENEDLHRELALLSTRVSIND